MTTGRSPISVHIERLVVDGLPLTAAQAARMQRALERELARLIARHGDVAAWAGGAAQPTAGVASPALPWDAARPYQLGRALAHRVFTSLNGPSPPPPGPRGRS
jgi:hypothetical protein